MNKSIYIYIYIYKQDVSWQPYAMKQTYWGGSAEAPEENARPAEPREAIVSNPHYMVATAGLVCTNFALGGLADYMHICKRYIYLSIYLSLYLSSYLYVLIYIYIYIYTYPPRPRRLDQHLHAARTGHFARRERYYIYIYMLLLCNMCIYIYI